MINENGSKRLNRWRTQHVTTAWNHWNELQRKKLSFHRNSMNNTQPESGKRKLKQYIDMYSR